MMDWNYELQNGRYLISMENGKKYFMKVAEVDNLQKQLKISEFEAIEMWLEDNGYLVNEEQEALCKQAKVNGSAKGKGARTETPVKKTPKERTQKENPTKELIISTIANALQNLDISNLNIENKAKLITFTLGNEDFKVDLTQKRKAKAEK